MKKKLLGSIIIILLIQVIFIFLNKPKVVKDSSIRFVEKEKNIEEMFLDIEKIEKLEPTGYSKVNEKWIGEFEFKGNLDEAKKLINNIKDFKINSYHIRKEEGNIYIEGFLEHK